MKLGVLFSGGKDSVYACDIARRYHDVKCLITLISGNSESYMFHTPNIDLTALQADAMGIPIIQIHTQGEKETELEDLRAAIELGITNYGIDGIVTGGLESVYQTSRVQTICHDLDLWCFNPLWKKDQIDLLTELVEGGYRVMISGIFAYPLTEDWLGRILSTEMITELIDLYERYQLNPSGEGGELETTVLDAPFFRKRLMVDRFTASAHLNAGVLAVEKAHLEEKEGIP
jgi:diphthine-ammonia ligase